jgi:hypothetical protein
MTARIVIKTTQPYGGAKKSCMKFSDCDVTGANRLVRRMNELITMVETVS